MKEHINKEENLRIRMGDMYLKNMNASWEEIYKKVPKPHLKSYQREILNKYK